MSDEQNPDGAVSLRAGNWRAHVPSALIYGTLLLLGQWGGCSKMDETNRKLDDLRDRVGRIEGALAPRLAAAGGARGAGGTAALPGD
jgi:hypothetical protein